MVVNQVGTLQQEPYLLTNETIFKSLSKKIFYSKFILPLSI